MLGVTVVCTALVVFQNGAFVSAKLAAKPGPVRQHHRMMLFAAILSNPYAVPVSCNCLFQAATER